MDTDEAFSRKKNNSHDYANLPECLQCSGGSGNDISNTVDTEIQQKADKSSERDVRWNAQKCSPLDPLISSAPTVK